MLHKFHAPVCQRLRVFFRPDGVLALFEDWASVLNNEFEFGVEAAELEGEAAFACM